MHCVIRRARRKSDRQAPGIGHMEWVSAPLIPRSRPRPRTVQFREPASATVVRCETYASSFWYFCELTCERNRNYAPFHNRLKVTEGGALSEMLQPHEDWRRGLNQSVREFASAAANADEDTVPSLVHTMLHEIGETLAIDCCMLVSLVDSQRAGNTYDWCRPMMSAAGLPFEARAFAPLFAQVRVERHVVIVESTREPGPDE